MDSFVVPFSLLRRGSIKSISGLKQVTLKLFFQEKFQSERNSFKVHFKVYGYIVFFEAYSYIQQSRP